MLCCAAARLYALLMMPDFISPISPSVMRHALPRLFVFAFSLMFAYAMLRYADA